MTNPIEHLGADLDDIASALRRVTVSVRDAASRGTRGQGAGIIWSPDGTIVTNAHVASGATARVSLADGRSADARLIARDRRRDLALLMVDSARLGGAALPSATLGAPSRLRAGDVVLALGHPLGVEHAMAMGVVHAGPDLRRSPYIAADIRLAPGNSGGPLADSQGRIVGVNSMIAGGLGVAISVDAVREFIAGAMPRPTLGVQLRPVQVRMPAGANTTSLGLLVLTVDPSGAAARGGVMQGDLLLGHAGRPFTSRGDLTTLLRDAGPGGSLRLDVGRGGRRMTCDVQLGAAQGGGRRRAA